MKKKIGILAAALSTLMIFSLIAQITEVAAAKASKSITIKFDSPNAAMTLTPDREKLNDYYVYVGSYAGIWNTGVVGFDEKEKAIYVTSPENASPSNVTRVHFEAKDPSLFIDSKTYQYAKVTYKLEANLPAGATYTMQIRDAAWFSSPINIFAKPNEWYTDPVDLRYMTAWMNKGTYDIGGGDIRENVGGGFGSDVATNGIMLQVEASSGNLIGAKLYIKSITFYEKREDAFPESSKATSSSITSKPDTTSNTTSKSDTASQSSITSKPTTVSKMTTSRRPSNYNKGSDGSNLPLIIGIVVAVVVVAAIAFVVAYLIRRKRRTTRVSGN